MLRTGAGRRSFSHLEAVVSWSKKPRPRFGELCPGTNSVPGELQSYRTVLLITRYFSMGWGGLKESHPRHEHNHQHQVRATTCRFTGMIRGENHFVESECEMH